GEHDPTFGVGGTFTACNCDEMSWKIGFDGKSRISLAGMRTEPGYLGSGSSRFVVLVARFQSDGFPAVAYGSGGQAMRSFSATDRPAFLGQGPGGSWIGAGTAFCCGPSELRLVRIDPTGAVDTAFAARSRSAISRIRTLARSRVLSTALIPRPHGEVDL